MNEALESSGKGNLAELVSDTNRRKQFVDVLAKINPSIIDDPEGAKKLMEKMASETNVDKFAHMFAELNTKHLQGMLK